jgi:protein-S-isoprenylcysteine O-methyltransferase Ste14
MSRGWRWPALRRPVAAGVSPELCCGPEGLLGVLAGHPLNLHSAHVRHQLQLLFAIAAALIAGCAWMRTWGTAYLRSEVVHDSALHSEKLVADGPYRHVRNPLYFGNVLLAAGIGMMASRTGWFVLVIGITLFLYRLIGREEAGLLKAQGATYVAYMAAVPRLLPALRPRVASGGMKPGWRQALAGEAHLWLIAAGAIGFTWTLNARVFLQIVGLAGGLCVLYLLVLRLNRRVARRTSR